MMPPALSTRLSEEYRLPLTLALLVGWQTAPFQENICWLQGSAFVLNRVQEMYVCMYV